MVSWKNFIAAQTTKNPSHIVHVKTLFSDEVHKGHVGMLHKFSVHRRLHRLIFIFVTRPSVHPRLSTFFFSLLFAVFIKPLLTTLWKASLGLGVNDALS